MLKFGYAVYHLFSLQQEPMMGSCLQIILDMKYDDDDDVDDGDDDCPEY